MEIFVVTINNFPLHAFAKMEDAQAWVVSRRETQALMAKFSRCEIEILPMEVK